MRFPGSPPGQDPDDGDREQQKREWLEALRFNNPELESFDDETLLRVVAAASEVDFVERVQEVLDEKRIDDEATRRFREIIENAGFGADVEAPDEPDTPPDEAPPGEAATESQETNETFDERLRSMVALEFGSDVLQELERAGAFEHPALQELVEGDRPVEEPAEPEPAEIEPPEVTDDVADDDFDVDGDDGP